MFPVFRLKSVVTGQRSVRTQQGPFSTATPCGTRHRRGGGGDTDPTQADHCEYIGPPGCIVLNRSSQVVSIKRRRPRRTRPGSSQYGGLVVYYQGLERRTLIVDETLKENLTAAQGTKSQTSIFGTCAVRNAVSRLPALLGHIGCAWVGQQSEPAPLSRLHFNGLNGRVELLVPCRSCPR